MNNLIKAMTYNHPSEIPISVGILPAVWKKYPNELQELTARFSGLFGERYKGYEYDEATLARTYRLGETVDEWGCVWTNIEEGMEAYVTGHPVQTKDDIRNLQIPTNEDGRVPHGFMYLRILDLMGFENAMTEFAEESDEIQMLIDKVVEYNLKQINVLIPKADEIIYFGDDLGMQKGLAIGPHKWRKYFKPAFQKLYAPVKSAGIYVYMHTDGCIYEIMPDLKEIGVDMINPQFRANGLDNLVEVCKGKIPINLDLDRQLLPFATPQQIDDHVRECVEALYLPEGGLGLSLEIGTDVSLENMEAAFKAVDKYRFYK